MRLTEIREVTAEVAEQVGELMQQLVEGGGSFTEAGLRAVVADANSHLYAMFDGRVIVGCATLCVFHSPTGTKASIEDVVIRFDYRGQHLGKALIRHLLQQARQYAPIELHLTSNPARVAANGLYQASGFEKRDTNCYRLNIPSPSPQ